jgi:hypothetical protein
MMIPHSLLSSFISRYLVLKLALGRRYAGESRILEILEQFLAHTNVKDLTRETFSEWCKTQKVTSTVLRRRMNLVHNLCLYRRRTEPDCFVPDAKLFPLARPPIPPYIFTETEIAKLIQAAGALKPVPRSPLRPQVSRLALVLLYTTGLRRGELLKLTIGDYDSQSRTLLVRESKFHKSRYLPLSSDANYLKYQKGGDSLAGRYFQFNLWPLTLGELANRRVPFNQFIKDPLHFTEEDPSLDQLWERLFHFSGFPEPYLSAQEADYRRWAHNYRQQLIREDIRNATEIKNIDEVEVLFSMLPSKVGSPLSLLSLSRDLQVSPVTVRN